MMAPDPNAGLFVLPVFALRSTTVLEFDEGTVSRAGSQHATIRGLPWQTTSCSGPYGRWRPELWVTLVRPCRLAVDYAHSSASTSPESRLALHPWRPILQSHRPVGMPQRCSAPQYGRIDAVTSVPSHPTRHTARDSALARRWGGVPTAVRARDSLVR